MEMEEEEGGGNGGRGRVMTSGAVEAVGEELQAGITALKERAPPLGAEAKTELRGLADAVVEKLESEDVEVQDVQRSLQVI